jgi:hypothetical protein
MCDVFLITCMGFEAKEIFFYFPTFKYTLYFRVVYQRKTEQKVQSISTYPTDPCPWQSFFNINIQHWSKTFLKTYELVLLPQYHSKSVVYITVHFDVIHSMGWDKCIMTRLCHCSIIQSGFVALKILCTLPIYLSLPSDL